MQNTTTSTTKFNLRQTATGFIRQFSIDPVRGAVIGLKGLATGERLLAILGYAFCALLLLLSLFLDAVSNPSETLKFSFTAAQSIHEMQPFAGLLGLMGYVLAWTFILTGAGKVRPLFFCVLLFLYVVFGNSASFFAQNLQAICYAPIALVALSVLYLLGRKLKLFDRAPALMFVLIGAVIFVNGALAFLMADDADAFGLSIYTFFRFVNYLAFPLWMYSGVSLIGFAMAFAIGVAKGAIGAHDSSALIKFAQIAVFVHLGIYVVIYILRLVAEPGVAGQFAPLISVFVSGLIVLTMLGLKAAKKLTSRTALSLLALSMAFGIFVAIVNSLFKLGFNATDPINAVFDKLGIFPRGTFFMFTLMVGVLGSFVPFASGDSRALPHAARVLISIGFAILFIAMMFVFVFTTNTADGSNYTGDSVFTGLTVFGALLIGIPLTLISLFSTRGEDEEKTSASASVSGALKALVILFPLITWLLNRGLLMVAR